MKTLRLIFAAGLIALVAGCVSAPGKNCVRLSYDGFFCLVPPAALPVRQGTALVTVSRKHSTHRFVGQLSITPKKMTLALYTLAGMPAATLHWNGRQARIDSPGKLAIEAPRLAALLELSLATPDTLDGALHGLTLTATRSGSKEDRRLMDGSNLVAGASSTADGSMHIHVPRHGLKITLKPVSTDANE